MTDIPVSRRSVACALAVAPIAALPVVAAAHGRALSGDDTMNMYSTITAAPDRTAWDAMMARYKAAQAASDEFDERVYRPIDREIERRAPRPDLTLKVPLADGGTYVEQLVPAYLDSDCERGRFAGAVEPIRDAWKAHEKAREEAKAALDFEAISAQNQRLWDEVSDAHSALLRMPAPHLAALRWKLQETIQPGDKGEIIEWCDEIRLAIATDYERLLPDGSADDER